MPLTTPPFGSACWPMRCVAPDAAMRRDLLAARPDREPLWTSLRAVLLSYVAWRANELVAQRRLLDSCPSLGQSRRDMVDHLRNELLAWAEYRHADTFALESVLLVNIAIYAVLTAYEAWEPDDGIARLVKLTTSCLDRVGTGLELHEGTPPPIGRNAKRRFAADPPGPSPPRS